MKATSKKTHCVRGHVLRGDNVMPLSNGKIRCRACHNDDSIRSYYRRKARETGQVLLDEFKRRRKTK